MADAAQLPSDNEIERLALVAKALSDPIRLRMLMLMAEAQPCCRVATSSVATSSVPTGTGCCNDEPEPTEVVVAKLPRDGSAPDPREVEPCCAGAVGISVGLFQSQLGLAQSRVSYHIKILREAGLLSEECRGRWTFYAVDRDAIRASLATISQALGMPAQPSVPGQSD